MFVANQTNWNNKMVARKPNYFQRFYRKLEIFLERARGLDFSQVTPSADLGYDGDLVIQ